jgi:hypothetical protein
VNELVNGVLEIYHRRQRVLGDLVVLLEGPLCPRRTDCRIILGDLFGGVWNFVEWLIDLDDLLGVEVDAGVAAPELPDRRVRDERA